MHQKCNKKSSQHRLKDAMLRMGAPGTPGAIGALIAAGSPTVGARYVGGCLGRGGRAIGDWTPGKGPIKILLCPGALAAVRCEQMFNWCCFVIWFFFNFQQKECFAAIVKNGSLLSNVGKMTWTRGLGPSPRSEPNQRVLGVQRSWLLVVAEPPAVRKNRWKNAKKRYPFL